MRKLRRKSEIREIYYPVKHKIKKKEKIKRRMRKKNIRKLQGRQKYILKENIIIGKGKDQMCQFMNDRDGGRRVRCRRRNILRISKII